jgi:hypothetical protein
MLQRVNPWDITQKISEFKRFIWICHISKKNILDIRPSWDRLNTDFPTTLEVINQEYPNVVILESFVEESIDKILEFGVPLEYLRMNDSNNEFKPIMMAFDKGWLQDTSIDRCYCLETLTELIMLIHPENFFEE